MLIPFQYPYLSPHTVYIRLVFTSLYKTSGVLRDCLEINQSSGGISILWNHQRMFLLVCTNDAPLPLFPSVYLPSGRVVGLDFQGLQGRLIHLIISSSIFACGEKGGGGGDIPKGCWGLVREFPNEAIYVCGFDSSANCYTNQYQKNLSSSNIKQYNSYSLFVLY